MTGGTFHWTWRAFAIFLALTLAVWLWPSIVGGRVLLPLDLLSHNPPHEPPTAAPVRNALIGDMLYENYTWHEFQRQAIRAGELPLWNPYTFAGHPLYATGQASTFYPLNALFWIVPLAHAYVVFTWVHLFLGGLFTYLFCRRMGVGGFGAAVGGTAFALGGFLTARLVFPMLLGSAVWLPLMLLWIDWMAAPRQLANQARGLLLGSLLFVQPILAGFIEIAFYAYVACGVFTLFRAAALLRQTNQEMEGRRDGGTIHDPRSTINASRSIRHPQSAIRNSLTFLLKVAVVPVFAALLAAPLLLPFFEVMHLNIRSGQGDYRSAKTNALAPEELLTTISPDALGNPAEHDRFQLPQRQWAPRGPFYFGPKNYVEAGFYFGLLPLAFLVLSLARRGRGFAFAWTLLVLAVALALVTPIYRLFYHCVPGAEQVRTPFRWMYLALFAGAVLAAMGAQFWYERLSQPVGRGSRRVAYLVALAATVPVIALFVLLFAPGPLIHLADYLISERTRIGNTLPTFSDLAGFLWINAFRFSIFALLAVVCASLAWWRTWSARTAGWLSLVALSLVAFDLGQASYGFYTHSDPSLLKPVPPVIRHMMADSGPFRFGRFGADKFLYANLSTLYSLQDFGGYDSIILKDYVTFLNAIENQHLVKYNIIMTIERARSLDSPLLPLLNIRYLLTRREMTHPDWQLVPVEGNVRLYRLRPERALPRAFMVSEVRAVGSLADALSQIKSRAVDVFAAAVVEAPVATAAMLAPGLGSGGAGRAEITDYGFSRVRVQTSAPRRLLLVLLDVYYPGWNAYIDGQRAEVYRTDGVFRGVSVPAGEHTVEFRFEPRSFRLGAMVAGACLLLILVLGVLGRGGQHPSAAQVGEPSAVQGVPPA